jgi:parallel beta-helix repeat protein
MVLTRAASRTLPALIVGAADWPGSADYRCDGADDQVQIAAAIATGKPVRLSPGSFVLSAAITLASNLVLAGAGQGVTILTLANEANAHALSGTSLTNLTIRDLSIAGNRANQTANGRAINLATCTDVLIADVEISDTYGNGINASACDRCRIERCRVTIDSSAANPIVVFQGSQASIVGCEVTGGSSAIYLNAHAGGLVQGCSVAPHSTGHGGINLKDGTTGSRVVGNVCTGHTNGHSGVEVYGSYNVIADNVIDGAGAGNGIEISTSGGVAASHNVLSGNICRNHEAEAGIWLRALDGAGAINYNALVGNQCYGNAYGIRMANSTDYTTLAGNVLTTNTAANLTLVGSNNVIAASLADVAARVPASYTLSATGATFATPTGGNAQEFWNSSRYRTKVDLTNATEARVVVRMAAAAAAGTTLRLQYSTNESAWNPLDGASGPSVAVDAIGTQASAWVSLAAGARQDVLISAVTANSGADGTTQGQYGTLQFQVR